MLEHTSNPIKALKEFSRVVKNNGTLLIILPDMNKTFEKRRRVTTLAHLLDDFEKDTPETDTTHFSEILDTYEQSLDYSNPDKATFAEKLRRNTQLRNAHHHTFTLSSARALIESLASDYPCEYI